MKKPLVIITGASSGFGAEMAKLFNLDNYPLLLLGVGQRKSMHSLLTSTMS